MVAFPVDVAWRDAAHPARTRVTTVFASSRTGPVSGMDGSTRPKTCRHGLEHRLHDAHDLIIGES